MRIINDIPVWGHPVETGALSQIQNCARTADAVALMGDHHKGYAVPIGGVVAYRNSISPSGVGYDIACGNKAVRTDADASEVRKKIAVIMDDIWKAISFGIGRKNAEDVDHPLFDQDAWKIDAVAPLKEMARQQLGTVGSGNHYVDIFEDESGSIWVGVHFGSRGLGHKTATYFLRKAGASDGMDVDPCILPADSDLGSDYLACMKLAGDYAYAGRDWVSSRVVKMLGANILEEVHNHHNFAWRETHNGADLWVVRKGATPAFPGQKGFVGGSMGDISVIIEGVENELASFSLYSSIHGAGRVMGRREAIGKNQPLAQWRCRNYRECDYTAAKGGHFKEPGGPTPKCPKCGHKLALETISKVLGPGKISRQMMEDWIRPMGVELRGAGVDESPHCYKRLPEVLEAHAGTIRVLHTLKPLGVAMAGANEFDPFKD